MWKNFQVNADSFKPALVQIKNSTFASSQADHKMDLSKSLHVYFPIAPQKVFPMITDIDVAKFTSLHYFSSKLRRKDTFRIT